MLPAAAGACQRLGIVCQCELANRRAFPSCGLLVAQSAPTLCSSCHCPAKLFGPCILQQVWHRVGLF